MPEISFLPNKSYYKSSKKVLLGNYYELVEKPPSFFMTPKRVWGGDTVVPDIFIIPENKFSIRLGHKTFTFDKLLKNIYDVIQESYILLNLKDDWDDDGAVKVNELTFNRAIEFLIIYSKYVLEIFDTRIKAPVISAGRDGSIDLSWTTDNVELLITTLNTQNFNIHYYGDDGNNNTIIKGFLNSLTVNPDLSYWMRKL